MGSYTDNLFKRLRPMPAGTYTARRKAADPRMQNLPPVERLVEVAIMLLDHDGDECAVEHGFRSHAELRSSLGWENPSETKRGTHDGLWTSKGRFLSRGEAKVLGYESGQVSRMERELLSSDVSW